MEYKLEDVLIFAGGGKLSVKRSESYATAPVGRGFTRGGRGTEGAAAGQNGCSYVTAVGGWAVNLLITAHSLEPPTV